jgi:competence ComEA-like helix-hairpin-helix protein
MRLLPVWLMLASVAVGLAGEPSVPLPPRVDLNNASKETLETLPGIGPKLAQEIMAGRPYQTVNELDRVKGIGPKKLEQLRPRVFVTPMARPGTNQTTQVNLNTAPREALEKLPGIGPRSAEAIIAARPFRRVEDLLRVPGIKRAQFERLRHQVVVR